MTAEEGLGRLARFFSQEPTRQGLLARRLLGAPLPGDADLATTLGRQFVSDLRSDGSVSGAFVPTAWRIIELADVGGLDQGAGRLAAWLLARQEQPGRFGEGCTPPRHAAHACEHFVAGFFAVADAAVRVAPLTLPMGKVLRSETTARFAASCLALRAVTVAGHRDDPAVRRHYESIAAPLMAGALPSDHYSIEMLAIGLSTLARASQPTDPARTALRDLVTSRQRPDGTWQGLDLFLALDALMADGTDPVRLPVRRAVAALLSVQRPDGTFGALARQERAWIALQVFVLATPRAKD